MMTFTDLEPFVSIWMLVYPYTGKKKISLVMPCLPLLLWRYMVKIWRSAGQFVCYVVRSLVEQLRFRKTLWLNDFKLVKIGRELYTDANW